MKVEIHRESFLSALQAVSGVVPSKSPRPILQNVKFVCGDLFTPDSDGPTLMATDMEIGILFRVGGVKVVEGGAVVLPPVKLREILSRATCETLTIESDGEKTKIRGTKCKYDLPSEDPDLYPNPMAFDAANYHTVAGVDLARLASLTMFCVNEDTTKYSIAGVLTELRADSIVMAATDGCRVAEAKGIADIVGSPKTYVNKATGDDVQAPVVPVKALRLLKGLLSHAKATDAPVSIAVGSHREGIAYQTEKATLTTRVFEGNFPRYQQAFPDEAIEKSRVELSAGDFADAVGQAAIATSEETRGVNLNFTTGRVDFTAQAADVGSSSVELDLPGFEGPEVKVTFDGTYLTDALRAIGPDATIQADFRRKEGNVFTVGDAYKFCVMPMVMS